MKKLSVILLAICTAVCCSLAVACGGEGTGGKTGKVNLVDYADKTIDVEYGGFYTVESFVYDTDGKSYALVSEVKDGDGNAVTISGKTLFIESARYTVKYVVNELTGKPVKTVTINAYNKPLITVDKTEYTVNIDVDGYYIPEITAVGGENADGTRSEITEIKKEIYYSGYLGDEKTDYNGKDANYGPKKEGTYYLKITALDEDGFSNTEKVVFYGKSYGTNPGMIMSEDTAERVKNLDSSETATFVENADLPDKENYDGTGGAAKIGMDSGNRIYISMNYSPKALSALDKEKYNVVRFAVYIKTEAETFMINGDQASLSNPCFMYNYYKKPYVFETNKWIYIETSLEDFITYCGGKTSISTDTFLLRTYQKGVAEGDKTASERGKAEVYIGDIEVSYKENTLFKTSKRAVNDVSGIKNNGFASNGELKKIFADIGDYLGGAVTGNGVSGRPVNVELGLTKGEISAFKSRYESVVFRIGVVYGKATVVTANSNERYKNAITVQSGIKNLTDGVWIEKTVTIDQLLDAMTEDSDDCATVHIITPWANISKDIESDVDFTFYIGDIEFVEKEADEPTEPIMPENSGKDNFIEGESGADRETWGGLSGVSDIDNFIEGESGADRENWNGRQ